MHRRGRRTPGRADPAQPRHQRHRPRARAGEIVVTVAADEQAAAIAVRDHGVGLAVGESAMVFNRFWRADPARARTSGGTGLGPGDLARGHPPARRLAAGLGQAARGRPVPADPAPARRPPAAPQPAPARARGRRGGGGMSRRTSWTRRAPGWSWPRLPDAVRPGARQRPGRAVPGAGPGAGDREPRTTTRHRPRPGAEPAGDRRRLPRGDDGDPAADPGAANVPHHAAPRRCGSRRTGASPTRDSCRPAASHVASRCGCAAPTASAPAASGWAAVGPAASRITFPMQPGERRVADRRGSQRAARAAHLLRADASQDARALLLRPDGPDPGPRARARAAGTAAHRPRWSTPCCSGPPPSPGRSVRTFVPPGLTVRAARGHQGVGRRRPQRSRPGPARAAGPRG